MLGNGTCTQCHLRWKFLYAVTIPRIEAHTPRGPQQWASPLAGDQESLRFDSAARASRAQRRARWAGGFRGPRGCRCVLYISQRASAAPRGASRGASVGKPSGAEETQERGRHIATGNHDSFSNSPHCPRSPSLALSCCLYAPEGPRFVHPLISPVRVTGKGDERGVGGSERAEVVESAPLGRVLA
jgi:hypothetical protein